MGSAAASTPLLGWAAADAATCRRLRPSLARPAALPSLLPADRPSLVAELRGSAGSIMCSKLRRRGQTPGIVFSGPGGEQQLLAFDSKPLGKLVTKLGRTAWACTVFDLTIRREDGSATTVVALGRQVHMTADTDAIENVTLIHCPPDRRVRVDVPLKVIGDDLSPGIKAGGRINWIRRTIPCLARGDAIPPDFTVDIRCVHLRVWYVAAGVAEVAPLRMARGAHILPRPLL